MHEIFTDVALLLTNTYGSLRVRAQVRFPVDAPYVQFEL